MGEKEGEITMKNKLWSRNFTLLTAATILGAAGGIAGGYAMSFLVYDETGSTLAAALLIALRVFPQFLLPILLAPLMDRLPRKPFLVWGDVAGGVLYLLAGLYLQRHAFSYGGYLLFSLVVASVGAADSLAYDAIFPKLIPNGCMEKGYAVGGMLYPMLNVVMMPMAALLMETLGVANILLLQGGASLLAALTESRIRLQEQIRLDGGQAGIRLWWQDLKAGFRYLKKEKGLRAIYAYMAVTNGAATGYGPILVAFFRSTPGFSPVLYSFFTVAEFLGRSIGGAVRYHREIPKKKRFSFAFLVYQVYETMDMLLLWLPYPAMLLNRGICGYLGIQSATMRASAVQQYIPEEFRARVNALEDVSITAVGGILALVVGALGELVSSRWALTITAGLTLTACYATIWRRRDAVRRVYENVRDNDD